jgi:flagellin FlaB
MREQKSSSDAFTGLEAAIVLIAFVVVAAVFSYVVLGAGFYTTQKSQETVYKSVEQATSNVMVAGTVYGIASEPASGIDTIEFAITLTPGAPDADLTKMSVMFSSDTVTPIVYYYGGLSPDETHFASFLSGTTTVAPAMTSNEQVTIQVKLYGEGKLDANERYNLEIRPAKGSTYAFTRTVGAKIFRSNIM